ncbi:MAG: TIGR00730 family Rossman fold protein [Bacteroidales bacterium]|nr:TIGR00730 family Rossman fold protein [Bacteroidales bacterium]
MKSVAVYLGSAPSCKDIYKGLAYELGNRIARAGLTLVYGGAAVGTMGALASGAREADGKVIGVFPRGFRGTQEVRESGLEVVQHGLSEFIETADFAERKQVMEDLSDGCIVMPGSFGTLDELFTYACNRAIDLHTKPILVFNFEGYYDPLKQLLANMQEAGFMKPVMASALTFCDTIEEIIEVLDARSSRA